MKNKMLIYVIVLFVFNTANGQMNLITEDFETNGENTRYTSNSFDDACHDFFERYSNGGGNCLTNEPTNASGTYYWAGEDVDAASGGTGIVTFNPLTVTGYNLELQVMAAIGRPNDFRFEPTDELLFQYNMDGGGWTTFGAFYGDNDGTGMGNLVQDVDLDGFHDGGLQISSFNFTDWTFPIPVTGNSLQVRFISGQNTGTEEIMVDNIRINSVIILPIELLEFGLQEMDNHNVNIHWETIFELDNEYFIVERSNNGNSWEEVTKILGAGKSKELSEYSVIDNNPFKGISYYRLKQIDLDGTISVSSIKRINLEQNQTLKSISIYPNPTNSEFFIEGEKSEIKEVQLLNAIGQDVSNLLDIEQMSDFQLKFLVSNLPDGIYFVKTKTTCNRVYIHHAP